MRDFLACAKIRPYPLPRPAAFLPAADEAESKVGIHCQPQRSGLFYKEKAFLSRLRRSANRRSFHCATPDFLSGLVALANFMLPSLRKAAYAVIINVA
jgi:hypothetical protein